MESTNDIRDVNLVVTMVGFLARHFIYTCKNLMVTNGSIFFYWYWFDSLIFVH